MRLKNIIIILALFLLAYLAYWFLAKDPARKDLGQLTSGTATSATTWCIYKVQSGTPVNQDPLLYKKGDIICIACQDTSTKVWPPKINGQQLCYTDVKFKTADGQAIYDLTLKDIKVKYCYTCEDAKGYYLAP